MIDALVRNKLPGMPNIAVLEAYSGSKKLLQALSSMVITQREGVLITDTGLAKLCGVENQRRASEIKRELAELETASRGRQ